MTTIPLLRRRSLWIAVWFAALFAYNIASHWPQNSEKSPLFIFLNALSMLTTPLNLLLSLFVVGGILAVGKNPSAGG